MSLRPIALTSARPWQPFCWGLAMPEPITTSRDTYASWDEAWYPRGPRMFLKLARDNGWDGRMGFSRGHVPAGKDKHEIRDMIGVYVDGYGRRGAAFWE